MQTSAQTTSANLLRRLLIIGTLCTVLVSTGLMARGDDSALAGVRHRVLVSTDIGGTEDACHRHERRGD